MKIAHQINFNYEGPADQYYTPRHESVGASGSDLRYVGSHPIVILPQTMKSLSTGILVEIPEGYEGQLRPRSGMSIRNTLILFPTIGTIDSDYRGIMKVNYYNIGSYAVTIEPGERIAQLVIAPYLRTHWKDTELSTTDRGANGFGSTGK